MTSKPSNSDDSALFLEAIGKVKPIKQDKIHPSALRSKHKKVFKAEKEAKIHASFSFSDEYEPNLSSTGPIKYTRDGVSSFEVKSLRRGQYVPEFILDLHGLNQQDAKLEIAALLHACQKEHVECACIVHGIGSKILKHKVPHWLVQHPDVMAFHQAPLEWGGNGALLVLIELHDKMS